MVAACTMTAKVADDGAMRADAGMAGMPANVAGSAAGAIGQGGVTIVIAPATGGSPSIWFGVTRELTSSEVVELERSACNTNSVVPETPAFKLELIVDASSSMDNPAPGTDRTKWEITRDALLETLVGVTESGLPANVAVGVVFFPNQANASGSTTRADVSNCLNTAAAVPMDRLGGGEPSSHRSLLRQRLNEVTLGRGAPTVDAYKWGLNQHLLPMEQSILGESYMLLITDGMPTLDEGCVSSGSSVANIRGNSVVSAVEGAFRERVKTFVIGVPGSEEETLVAGSSKPQDARFWLSNTAISGGTSVENCSANSPAGPFCHMDLSAAPDYAVALEAALNRVTSSILACKFAVPTKSTDGTLDVNIDLIAPIVRFGDGITRVLGRWPAANADCSNGFRLVSDAQLELCSDTCREYRSDPNASLGILVGCTAGNFNPQAGI